VEELLFLFNGFFNGEAEATIVNGSLKITIGNRTLIISLPEIIGGSSTGLS